MAGDSSPISSRKIVPASASSNFPMRRPAAPVNAPRSCPKSSLSSSVSGIAAQLMATNAPAAPRGERVDRVREELLARSALALEQDRRVGRRDALRLGAHCADRGRLADDRRNRLRVGLGEEERLARARAALDRPRDEQPQQVGIDRLGDEVFGAVLHRLDRRLDRAERRHHEHRQRRIQSDGGVQHGQPVGPRKPPVGQDEVQPLPSAQALDRRRAGRDADDLETFRLQHLLEHRAQGVLVLDDQDAGHGDD